MLQTSSIGLSEVWKSPHLFHLPRLPSDASLFARYNKRREWNPSNWWPARSAGDCTHCWPIIVDTSITHALRLNNASFWLTAGHLPVFCKVLPPKKCWAWYRLSSISSHFGSSVVILLQTARGSSAAFLTTGKECGLTKGWYRLMTICIFHACYVVWVTT